MRSRCRTSARGASTAALVALATLCVVLFASPSYAAGYRYWSFWYQKDGAWAYATQGPSTSRPADGDVEGFRFSVSADSQDASKPRGTAKFGEICADTPAKDGSKRIAVVVDFGTAGDAPKGETPPKPRSACAQISENGTSAEALAAVAEPLRYGNDALLCAIAGYPKAGCGEQVAEDGGEQDGGEQDTAARETGKDSDGDGGPSVGLIAGAAAVCALGAAAVWQARRRRG
ncbi:SCO2322 family protein [Streptomyces monticola]|uniref:SCO2322 family protein n=1 Tax=Streptomyces monticola TaxID=2666263 RepID=A0ABW2JT49_9ACTN